MRGGGKLDLGVRGVGERRTRQYGDACEWRVLVRLCVWVWVWVRFGDEPPLQRDYSFPQARLLL